MIYAKKIQNFSSFQIITLGFLLAISVGCFLLMLPISSKAPGGTPFLNALFTSTSAVCVTGLVVYDTATYWSGFGQTVILLLIQIGGMGVVTLSVSMAMLAGRKIGLFQRSTMQEAIAAHSVGGIVRLTGFILRVTFAAEFIGAAVMAPIFCREFGVARGLWYAVFHSISAFCNAGFDLMGVRQKFSSLTGFVGSPCINLVISALIVMGGIGFLTWEDIRMNKQHLQKYRMQSKIIFTVTAVLIVLPTAYFYFAEFSRPEWQSMSGADKLLAALFQTISPRTAGFNTVDLSAFCGSSQTLMILLMLIGGSPGSTAGGIKTTTIAVLLLSAWSVFQRSDTHCFGRRIADHTVKYASAVLMMYLSLFLFGGMLISAIENLPMVDCLFETASAIATVGLSLGITAKLSAASRIILIVLMYFGRVGGLTLVFAAIAHKSIPQSRYPQEKIIVG